MVIIISNKTGKTPNAVGNQINKLVHFQESFPLTWERKQLENELAWRADLPLTLTL